MDPLTTLVVGLAVAGMLGWLVFTHAGIAARPSAARRRAVLFANSLTVLIGVALSVWLALRISETDSPSSRVATILLVIVGGGLIFLGIAAFLGAWFTRPGHDDGSSAGCH